METKVCPICKGERCKVFRAGNITVAIEPCKHCNGLGKITKQEG